MHRWLALATVALISLPALATADDETPRIAILAYSPTLDTVKVDQLAHDMASGLELALDVEVRGGLDVRRALPADLPVPNCVNEPGCPARIATQLGVQQLLFVVFVDIAGAVQVDTTWFDAATNKSATRPGFDIAATALPKQRFVDASRKLLPDATVRPGPTPIAMVDGGRMTEEIPRHFTTTSTATAIVGFVGLAVGTSFAISTRNRYIDCDAGACTQAQQDAIRSRGLLADAAFVVGIGGAVATAILYATSGTESRLVIETAPSGATVGARLRF